MSVESKVKSFIDEKIDQGLFTGASVVFAQNGRKFVSVHRGSLSKRSISPVNASTTFDLQSMTKALVTGPLFLKLQKDKKIDLDAPIGQYLPASAPKNLANSRISFRHLLTHSAGFSDVDMEEHFESPYEFWNKIFTAPIHSEPGNAIEYSDLGYRILGKLLESVLGESLESAAHRYLFSASVSRELGYSTLDPFNVAGCPNAHGAVDDEQVRQLGGILGCDGLFGSAEGIFKLLSGLIKDELGFGGTLGYFLHQNIVSAPVEAKSYFDALAAGSKSIGWEVNPKEFTYAGKFHTPQTFEKAGGAGTFAWFDEANGGDSGLESGQWQRCSADIGQRCSPPRMRPDVSV